MTKEEIDDRWVRGVFAGRLFLLIQNPLPDPDAQYALVVKILKEFEEYFTKPKPYVIDEAVFKHTGAWTDENTGIVCSNCPCVSSPSDIYCRHCGAILP